MKKIICIFFVLVLIFTSCTSDDEVIIIQTQKNESVKKENHKISICHYDDETGEYHTINVSKKALKAHLAHGDIIGDCDDNLICHWVDPIANTWQQLLVKDEDLQEHLDHGDFLGSCGTDPGNNFTFIPDRSFEQALIDLGLDSEGTLNNRVLTTDISSLIGLNVAGKGISDLTGIADFTNLRVLNFSNNLVTQIDVSENSLLTLLRFNNNKIVNIDVSNNIFLREFYGYDNLLLSLDFNNNTNLRNVYCWNNKLLNVNIKNGTNSLINRFYAWSNPNLDFITVDDPNSANLGLAPYTPDKWRKDSSTAYN